MPKPELVIVTPAFEDGQNVQVLADQLRASTVAPMLWIVVDDGSRREPVDERVVAALPFRSVVLRRDNQGGLINGSAFSAWRFGVEYLATTAIPWSFIMKLDADVELPADYLERVLSVMSSNEKLGLVGGWLTSRGDREQLLHVPGPIKLYSRRAYESLAALPSAVGFDVMDEVALKSQRLEVLVLPDVPVRLRRHVGASQGLIHGRFRNGLVCRWTGYDRMYFLFHVCRYVFRPPYIVGAAAMIRGYVTAPESPYPPELRRLHAAEQRDKLRAAMRNPVHWLRSVYGFARP